MYLVVFRAEVVFEHEEDLLTRDQQRQMLRMLESDPRSQKPLTRALHGCYRWRTGDIRVVFTVDDRTHTVTVIAIGRRRDNEIYTTANRRYP